MSVRFLFATLAVLFVSARALTAAPVNPERPNIIYIMADELGYYGQIHAHTDHPPYLVSKSSCTCGQTT